MANTKKSNKSNINNKKKVTKTNNLNKKNQSTKKIIKEEPVLKKTVKKSNYNKIQSKVLEEKNKKNEQNKNKKIVKQNKQVARNIKKEKEKKERSFKRKALLILLSILIKLKNLFINIFKLIKKLILLIIKLFGKIILLIKMLFLKIKIKKNIKEEKNNKIEEKEEELEDTKEYNKLVVNEKKIIRINNRKPLRSLTGRVLPSTFLKGDRKIRKTYYLKEALIFMIILTLIDFMGFYRVKKIDMFHLFDNSIWNIVLTTSLTLLVTFFASYIIDYFVTETTLRIRKRKK